MSSGWAKIVFLLGCAPQKKVVKVGDGKAKAAKCSTLFFLLLPLFFPARSSNIQRVGSSFFMPSLFSPSLVSPSPSLPTTTTSCLIPPPVQQLTCMKVCGYAARRTCQQLLTAHEGSAKKKNAFLPRPSISRGHLFCGAGKMPLAVLTLHSWGGRKRGPFSLENPGLSYRA